MVIIENSEYTKISVLSPSLSHSYIQVQVNGNNIKLLGDAWQGCRESLYYYWKRNKTDRTQAILTYNKVFSPHDNVKARTSAAKEFRKGIRRALKVVRLFEEYGDIKPKISVSFLPLASYGRPGSIGALFVFSPEWATNPVMHSMLTLFMRTGKYFCNREVYKNIEEFVKYPVSDNTSTAYFFTHRKYWATFIKNRALLLKEAKLGAVPHYYGCQGFFTNTQTDAQKFFKERFM